MKNVVYVVCEMSRSIYKLKKIDKNSYEIKEKVIQYADTLIQPIWRWKVITEKELMLIPKNNIHEDLEWAKKRAVILIKEIIKEYEKQNEEYRKEVLRLENDIKSNLISINFLEKQIKDLTS